MQTIAKHLASSLNRGGAKSAKPDLFFLRVLCVFAVLSLSIACAAPPTPAPQPSRTLTVFAASSLLDAFNEIKSGFELTRPGVTVLFNFDGSHSLRAQLEQGAAADVFASANQKEMDAVIAASLAGSGAATVFATNQLVVITPANGGQPANVHSLADLARPGVALVLAAEDVPVGDYARTSLANLESQLGPGYKDNVLANVVSSEDNVKQVVAKVQLGEADAGIVYTTDAAATPDLVSITIPAEYNVTARYPIAALSNAPQPELAAEFVTYVLSADGQAVLKKWGFGSAAP